ncbi:hypothetical protein AB1Y20_021128 [Prymnesium parvum]|uniref:Mitochondrial carrier protein n=1 Tax=Prymnesium parvum TaxID=97485 RepID=A0AB34JHW9_PRYPA
MPSALRRPRVRLLPWLLILTARGVASRAVELRSAPEPKKSGVSHFCGISVAGATACSITHSLVVPLDVIKTRMQMDSSIRGPLAAAAAVFKASHKRGLLRCCAFFNGIVPTAMGYCLQGATKFGGYELMKHGAFTRLRASGGEDAVQHWTLPIMLVSAAAAELCATTLLAPLEVLKLRIQTDAVSASRGLRRTLTHILRHENPGTLYAGFVPIAMRQLPYTVTKLVVYEVVVKVVTRSAQQLELAMSPESSGDRLRPYAIVLAGLFAGAAAAIVSHPADLLLTRICGCATSSVATNVAECVIADGFIEQAQYLMSMSLGEAFSGLGPRLAMTSIMTSIQFVLYDNVRLMLGVSGSLPPPPAVELVS